MKVRSQLFLCLLGVVLGAQTAHSSYLVAQTPLDPKKLTKWRDPVPVLPKLDGTQAITMTSSEFPQQVLPSNFTAGPYLGKTLVWGYNQTTPGPTIEVQRGTAATVTYINDLVNPVLQKYLSVDQTIHWADPLMSNCMMQPPVGACGQPYQGPQPGVTHLHGGETPSEFDGNPDAWFTPGFGKVGPAFTTNVYTYPNMQEPTTLWYHDHVLGATRLDNFAGLAGFYLLRDAATEPANLPAGTYERELVIQDRMFDTNGQLMFPDTGVNPGVHPFWIPEFFGNVVIVNGKAWPYLNVEPRRYRLRLLNAANARFFDLRLSNQLPFWQIGTDGGYLDKPVKVPTIFIAPSERADVIVDFTGLPVGTTLTMTNTAKAPFPSGTPADPQTVGQVLQFRVVAPATGTPPDTSLNPAAVKSLRPANPIVRLRPNPASVPTRRLTLNEVEGPGGPLAVLLNNSSWSMPTTETPRVGSTEIWEVINTTADTHPIHIHLIQFQLLSRQPYRSAAYTKLYESLFPGGKYIPEAGPPLPYGTCAPGKVCGGNPDVTPFLQMKPVPPSPEEAGWKDTVKMHPGEVTRIAIRWAPTNTPTKKAVPGKNLYTFNPSAGPGYVWHCHILDHEDNEMMRPYVVAP